MTEYIEREAAISGLNELERTSHHNSVLWPDHVEECRETLRSIHAADVRPVVRARWQYKTITVPGGKGQTYAKWCCTVCKGKAKERTAFCPNCGADMREES